ncbi:hypothetical protein V492_04441 [Pseudogymnoascus sp. VKM F-4246]|nr:hypothetical protein V492_04441 [Pseudogymnoascus sp. VKM F-4246]
MKRERQSDDEADGQRTNTGSGAFSTGYGVFNPGCSFARPPGIQSKPNTKRPRIGDSNAPSDAVPLKPDPEPESAGPSGRNNLPDVQTPASGTPALSDVHAPTQPQSLDHHSRESDTPVFTANGLPADEETIMSTIKEKLHDAIFNLTSAEPTPPPPESLPPWSKYFALQGPCPKMTNPALSIYGLGGIGLPLSERDAGFIAKLKAPPPDPDTKMENAVVDLTEIRITELTPLLLETSNPGWEKAVEGIVGKVVKKLKVPGSPANVGFLPFNMTLFGPGDMLERHLEPNRGSGVFGTLAICLPSKHEGGDLIVTHGDQVKVLSTAARSAFEFQHLFWYTDMLCELTEVTSGHRLVLQYDLIDLDSRDKVVVPISLESKKDDVESALMFWKNNYSEQSTPSAKFLAYTLDNMYDEQSLSHTVLEGDDAQRVNVLTGLCKKCRLHPFLAKLELRVGRENHEGPTKELLELQHVVHLNGRKFCDAAPWGASQIVQPNLSDVFKSENVSGFIGNGDTCVDQVYYRFVVILVLDGYAVDLFFEWAKSSAVRMGRWIYSMRKCATQDNPNGNKTTTIDLKRACQLVIKDIIHQYDTKGPISNDPDNSPGDIDDLLEEVIIGSIYMNDEILCGEALSLVRTEIPVPDVVDAIKCFGFSKLQQPLDKAICSFKHMYQAFEAFLEIFDHYEKSKDSTSQEELVTWIKTFAEKMFREQELLPIVRAANLFPGKSAAVLSFLTIIAEGYEGRNIGHRTARHVIHSALQVYIPRIQVIDIQGGRENCQKDILVKTHQITRILRLCVTLELKLPIDLLFDRLRGLLRTTWTTLTFEEFFLPLINEFDEMPPGQTLGTIAEEFHFQAHQFAENFREEELGCTCKACVKFTSFTKNPKAKSVNFTFSSESESGLAHYKTYQLAQFTKGGYAHTCTISPSENGSTSNYSITVQKTKTHLSTGTEGGKQCQKTTPPPERPNRKGQEGIYQKQIQT